MERNKCKVINCNASSLNGQEGYCPEHYDDLLRMREENIKNETKQKEVPDIQLSLKGDRAITSKQPKRKIKTFINKQTQ